MEESDKTPPKKGPTTIPIPNAAPIIPKFFALSSGLEISEITALAIETFPPSYNNEEQRFFWKHDARYHNEVCQHSLPDLPILAIIAINQNLLIFSDPQYSPFDYLE